jgi:putative flippase GtrA
MDHGPLPPARRQPRATPMQTVATVNSPASLAAASSQFFRYVIVGAAAFVVDVALLVWLAEGGMHYLAANSIAFLAANLFNFAVAHRFVFASGARTSDWRTLYLVILVISVAGLAINDLLLYAATAALGLPLVAAKIVATMVTLLWNFHARKRLAYY